MAVKKFYPGTLDNQTAIIENQRAAKDVVDDTNTRVRALQPAVAANGAATASVAAHLLAALPWDAWLGAF